MSRSRARWSLPATIPGASGPSIYDWIARRQGDDYDPFAPLPDEQVWVSTTPEIQFIPGAHDAVLGVDRAGSVAAAAIGDLLLAAVRDGAAGGELAALYEAARQTSTLGYLDPLLTRVAQSGEINAARLRELALWLVVLSPDRMPLKLGLALLGISGRAEDAAVLRVAGGHDELTLYSVVALTTLLPPAEARAAIWDMARSTTGWGRIEAVRRLGAEVEPEIRAWLLREGFRNVVMNEELAFIAATSGGLAAALGVEQIDRALFRGAGDLLAALISSPFAGIDGYDAAPAAVAHYLRHATTMARELRDHVAVRRVHEFLSGDPERWEDRFGRGWTVTSRRQAQALAAEILRRPVWRNLVVDELASSDRARFAEADAVARSLGLDTVGAHVARLGTDPTADAWHWSCILSQTLDGEMPAILTVAEKRIDPTRIATGARLDLGLGPGFERHNAVDIVLTVLPRYPGMGLAFVLPALQSPVTRNRWLAAQALRSWGRDTWPAGVEAAVRAAVAAEPDTENRALLSSLLV